MNKIQEIKDKILIHEFIGKYTALKKSGNNWLGKCPFPDHNEKTPSFCVSGKRYKCFGCGKYGDIITFVQEYLSLSMPEALKFLCKHAGIQYTNEPKQVKHSAYNTLEAACQVYEKALQSHTQAIQYLHSRGIKDYKKYRIGWSGTGLLPNASQEELEQAGLMKNGRTFFYSRIMFPIIDSNGICGFGGRNLDERHPKYLNSPQTEVFDKSKTIYRFHCGGDLHIVEGYTDVIVLAENKISAVASMGTSITEEHLNKIWQINSAPYIAFDGDGAGRKATERLINISLPYLTAQKTLKIMQLPATEDPASIVQDYGIADWQEYKKNAKSIIEVFLEHIHGSPEDKLTAKHFIKAQLAKIKDYELRNEYHRSLNIHKSQIMEMKLPKQPKINLQKYLLGLLYQHPELCKIFQDEISRLELDPCYEKYRLLALTAPDNPDLTSKWHEIKNWAQPHPDPEEGWRELYVHFTTLIAHDCKSYIASPTEENWTQFLQKLKQHE
jgi:DNA primase